MANYYANARSNYFRVKDPAGFQTWCEGRNLEFWTKAEDTTDKWYAISPASDAETGWPDYLYIEETDEEFEIDIAAELAPHLDPRDIAVLMQVGNERLRYLTGEAIAVAPTGEICVLTLDDIYDKALTAFKGDLSITSATY